MGSSGDRSRPGGGEEGERPVRRVKEVNSETGDVDFGEHDGLVQGDVLPGAAIRGDGDVHVLGGLKGEADRVCRLEVAGDVRVDGCVVSARMRGRQICISGDVADSRITADLGLDVRGSFKASEASLGNRTADLARLTKLRADYERLETRLGELKVKVGSAGRRFVRDYPQVDLATGGIIIPLKRELQVDLSPFYRAVAGRTPDEVDRALEEFYLRVLVGSLTRANRNYVSRNPSRQKIFLKLIEELRGHVRTVREADRLQEEAGGLLKKRHRLLDELKRPAGIALRVGAQVGGEVRLRLIRLCCLEGTASGEVGIEKSVVEARITRGSDGPMLEITDAAGRARSEAIGAGGLSHGAFHEREGRVVWEAEA